MKLKSCITLHFNGQCEMAFRFYEQKVGAKIAFLLTWGDSPMAAQAPAGWEKKVLHGRIRIGDADFVGGDLLSHQYEKPTGFSILLSLDDPAEGKRIFNALSANGTVTMPMQKTFWAEIYGCLTDQFGVPWEINCEKPGLVS